MPFYPSCHRADTGDTLYLRYKRATPGLEVTEQDGGPIYFIDVLFGHGLPEPGFKKIKVDCNEGAGGEYIYLTYQKGRIRCALFLKKFGGGGG